MGVVRPIYEIDADFLTCVDPETGEIIDPEKLDALNMEREKKIEGVILWRKDILAEMNAVKEEIKNLSSRAKTLENKAESLKGWVDYALMGEKFKTSRCSVSYRKTSSIVIDDPKKVPAAFWKDITEDWISKTALKDAIESGKEILGAHQEEKQSIIIK